MGKLNEIIDSFNIRKNSNYTINTKLFNVAMVAICIFLIYVFYTFGLNMHVYSHCPENRQICINEAYGKCQGIESWQLSLMKKVKSEAYTTYISEVKTWCNTPSLLGGESFGKQEPWQVKHFNMIVVLILGLTFIINHLLYNRGVKFAFNPKD